MQGARAPGLSFPQALTECVAGGMASSASPQRTSAHLLGSAALQQVDGQLPDGQSALLLTAAWQEVGPTIFCWPMHFRALCWSSCAALLSSV